MSESVMQPAALRSFAAQVSGHINDSPTGTRVEAEAIYGLVQKDPVTARMYVDAQLRNPACDDLLLLQAAAVAIGYQMYQGDASLWLLVEARVKERSYSGYERLQFFNPYCQVDFWEEASERTAAREFWLMSGREQGICDKCRRNLPRGDGFLVRLGAGPRLWPVPILIDSGEELYCHQCFAGLNRSTRRPLPLAEWGRLTGRDQQFNSFLTHAPPAAQVAALLESIGANETSLEKLLAWVKEHQCIGRTHVPTAHQQDAWKSWTGQLAAEAKRANELRKINPKRAVVLGRAILLLSVIVQPPVLKMEVLDELGDLFAATECGFEHSEVLAEMVVAYRMLEDTFEGRQAVTFQVACRGCLKLLTNVLHTNHRFEEALLWAWDWLATTMVAEGEDAARKPRFAVGKALLRLKEQRLARQAFESNGLVMWLANPSEAAPLDADQWANAVFYGIARREEGQTSQAIEVFSLLQHQVPQGTDRTSVAFMLCEFGLTYNAAGNTENAQHYLERAVALSVEAGDKEAAEYRQQLLAGLAPQRYHDDASSKRESPNPAGTPNLPEHAPFAARLIELVNLPGQEAVGELLKLEHEVRLEGNPFMLATVLINLALARLRMDPPILRDALVHFRDGIVLADQGGHHKACIEARVAFANELFVLRLFDECQQILDEACRAAVDALSQNLDSATRQELLKVSFTAFEMLIELHAQRGDWSAVVAIGEQVRARTLSRWMSIGSLQPPGTDLRFDNLVLELRASEVELEVRHFTRAVDGLRLRSLNDNRDNCQSSLDRILARRGLACPVWKSHFRPRDAIEKDLVKVIQPNVATLFLFSTRTRIHWVVASLRSSDGVIGLVGVPPFWEWPYSQRLTAVTAPMHDFARTGRDLTGMVADGTSASGELARWYALLHFIGDVIKKRGVQRLIVVPHRELALLPIWPLIDHCGLDGFVVAPSLEAAAACDGRSRAVGGATLVVSDPTASLPFARREVEMVSTARQAHGSVLPIDRYALLREQGPNSALIHVATHGNFYEENPYESGFPIGPPDEERGAFARFTSPAAYSPSAEPSLGGYRLVTAAATMGELSLSACRLVVLSTCESGIPRQHDGGEMVGLPNAFLLAGAKSVIASLWKVDDRATCLLMQYFYETWSGGLGREPSPAASLALARRRLKQTDHALADRLLGPGVAPVGAFPFDHPTYTDAFYCQGAW